MRWGVAQPKHVRQTSLCMQQSYKKAQFADHKYSKFLFSSSSALKKGEINR